MIDGANILLQTLSRAGRDIAFFFITLMIFLTAFTVIAEQEPRYARGDEPKHAPRYDPRWISVRDPNAGRR